MKRKAMVVIFGVLFLLMLVSCAEYQKQATTTEEPGILVWIAPSGKVVKAINSDGSALKYAPKDKNRIVGGRLVFLVEGMKEPTGFLKKVNGKWQSAPIAKEKVAKENIRQGVIAFVSPRGRILRITNMDGTEAKFSGDMSALRVMSVRGAVVRCYIRGIPYYSCPPCAKTCC
jgi:hypothetical protein